MTVVCAYLATTVLVRAIQCLPVSAIRVITARLEAALLLNQLLRLATSHLLEQVSRVHAHQGHGNHWKDSLTVLFAMLDLCVRICLRLR